MINGTDRLQRWLDRLSAACENRKWKSAVAEADCLSAELKQVRDELWSKAEGEAELPLSLRVRNYAAFGARSFAIAMTIICLCTFPIAVESGKPEMVASVSTGAENKFEEFTMVTTEEKELLQMLRKNLNDSNISVAAVEKKLPEGKAVYAAKPAAKPQLTQLPPLQPKPARKGGENRIKAEDLLTLIQIGEKSLRGSDSAIKILP